MKAEAIIQSQIVELLSRFARKNKFIFFSVPNEAVLYDALGQRKDALLNHLKKLGMIPGVSDLVIIKNGLAYCLEVKSDKGKQSEKQKIFAGNVLTAGGRYNICNSFNEGVEILRAWGIV
jgi:hypothetical protein